MGKVFVGQTNLKLVLETNIDLTGALTKEIRYRKPDSTEVLTLIAANEGVSTAGKIAYTFLAADTEKLDISGAWYFWAYIVFADNRVARGETAVLNIYEE